MQPRKFASLRHCFGGAVVWFIVLMARLVFPTPMITRCEPGERMSASGTNRTFASPHLKVRLRADSGRSVPNVSFRAENRRYSRGR